MPGRPGLADGLGRPQRGRRAQYLLGNEHNLPAPDAYEPNDNANTIGASAHPLEQAALDRGDPRLLGRPDRRLSIKLTANSEGLRASRHGSRCGYDARALEAGNHRRHGRSAHAARRPPLLPPRSLPGMAFRGSRDYEGASDRDVLRRGEDRGPEPRARPLPPLRSRSLPSPAARRRRRRAAARAGFPTQQRARRDDLRHHGAHADEGLLADLDRRAPGRPRHRSGRPVGSSGLSIEVVAAISSAHRSCRSGGATPGRGEDLLLLLERRVGRDVGARPYLRHRADRGVVLDQEDPRPTTTSSPIVTRSRTHAGRRRGSRAHRASTPANSTAPVETIVPSPTDRGWQRLALGRRARQETSTACRPRRTRAP